MAKSKKDPRSPKPNRKNWVKRMKFIKLNQNIISKYQRLWQI